MKILYVQNPESLSDFFKISQGVRSDTVSDSYVIPTGQIISERKPKQHQQPPVIDPNIQTLNQAKDEVKRDEHNEQDVIPVKTSAIKRKLKPKSAKRVNYTHTVKTTSNPKKLKTYLSS